MRRFTTLPYTEYPVAVGNFDTSDVPNDKIVLHTTGGSLKGALAWFNNPKAKVSANYIIDSNGDLYALLEEYYTSYANGNYSWNQTSFTIEHVDNGDSQAPRSDAQYAKSALLVADLCKTYSIPCDRKHIFKHNETPGSSTSCPGGLDIERIVRQAQAILKPQPPEDKDKIILDLRGTVKRLEDEIKAKDKQIQETNASWSKKLEDQAKTAQLMIDETKKKYNQFMNEVLFLVEKYK